MPTEPLLFTEFTALLNRSGLSQRAFAKLADYTPQHVNAWCRGRKPVPTCASLLLKIICYQVELAEITPQQFFETLRDVEIEWWETLGVAPEAQPSEVRTAWKGLAKQLHPDFGGNALLMARVNAAYEHFKRLQAEQTNTADYDDQSGVRTSRAARSSGRSRR